MASGDQVERWMECEKHRVGDGTLPKYGGNKGPNHMPKATGAGQVAIYVCGGRGAPRVTSNCLCVTHAAVNRLYA